MVLNSVNFCLSVNLFISPSILNETLARYTNLVFFFSPFISLNISCHSLLASRVSAKVSAVKHIGFPLYVTFCFSLAGFNILSLCLVFVSLISVSWHVCPWVYPVWDSVLLELDSLFPFPCWGNFNYNLFKNFLLPFIFLFFFWNPYI